MILRNAKGRATRPLPVDIAQSLSEETLMNENAIQCFNELCSGFEAGDYLGAFRAMFKAASTLCGFLLANAGLWAGAKSLRVAWVRTG